MTKEEKEQKILSMAATIRARNMWKKKSKKERIAHSRKMTAALLAKRSKNNTDPYAGYPDENAESNK